MSELVVGSIKGLASNSFEIDIATGSTLDLANAKAGSIPKAALPSGSILQVVQTVKRDSFSTTSASFTDITGLSAAITPTAASSKILIFVAVTMANDSGGRGAFIQLTGGATSTAIGDSSGSRVRSLGAGGYDTSGGPFNAMFLDSPNTTSATTYQVQGRRGDAGTALFGRTRADTGDNANTISTITLMEVAG